MKRLAICIRGDFRSWEHTKEFFFSSYETGEYDVVDYFITTYNKIAHSYRTITHKVNDATIKGNRPHPWVILYKTDLPVDRIKNDFKGKNLIAFEVLDDTIREQSISNQYYLMYKCNLLKRNYENENNFIYDCVISTRTDLLVKNNRTVNNDRWINGGESMFWTNHGTKVDFGQDLQFYGRSLTMDTWLQLYHVFNTEFDSHLCVHSFLGKYITKSEVGYNYPSDIICLYRKDGINHVALNSDIGLKTAIDINNTWHGGSINNRHIPSIKDNTIIKCNYDENKTNHVIDINSLLKDQIYMLLSAPKFIKMLNSSHLLKKICKSADKIVNYDLIDTLKEIYKTHNIVCNTSFSLEETALLLSILDITPYISKIFFSENQQSMNKSRDNMIDTAKKIIDILDAIESESHKQGIVLNLLEVEIEVDNKTYQAKEKTNVDKFFVAHLSEDTEVRKIITNCFTEVYNIFANIILFSNDSAYEIYLNQFSPNSFTSYLENESAYRNITFSRVNKYD